MKGKIIISTLLLSASIFVGCAGQNITPKTAGNQQKPSQTTPAETTPNVVTTASIVNTTQDFKKAISDSGTWIIAVTKDITFNNEITLNGEFKNGKKDKDGKDIIQRKVALYAQDENRKVTARYTLTAPKFNINSPEASIQHGTFKGDLYVSSKNFQLVDTIVEGNVYFTNAEAKSTFKMDATSKVTGKQELVTGNQKK